MRTRLILSAFVVSFLLAPAPASSQVPVDVEMSERIKEEGRERSRALDLYHTLTDEIGGRLTGSPAYDAAANWAREQFADWGLSDARLEAFEFGRGWTLDKLSVEMVSPRYIPLIAYAEAWTPSVEGVLSGPIVYVGDKTASEIEAMASVIDVPITRCDTLAAGFSRT